MAPAKLQPSDPRAPIHKATINGKTYGYRLSKPSDREPTGTIVLIHGFPDIGFGWRNQILFLAEELGLQVIVPDMIGYGQTDAPEEVALYGYKSVCADLVALVDHVGIAGDADGSRRFFVGGHDWGGGVAWRMPLFHGERLRGVFSICTPYLPPSTGEFVPLDQIIEKRLPNFRYQLQFSSNVLADAIGKDPAKIRHFLDSMYGGTRPGPDGKPLRNFSTADGVDLEHLDEVGPNRLLSPEVLDYYVQEYSRHGLYGATNWYRTTQVNYDSERELVATPTSPGLQKIAVPSLMVVAENDVALPPAMAANMDQHFEKLTKRTVPGTHWVLWQEPESINEHIREYLGPLLGGAKASI